MSKWITTALVTLFVAGVGGCAMPSILGSGNADEGNGLDWFVGCWVSEDGAVEETWTKSRAGDQLFGYSVTTQNGKTVFFEQLRVDTGEPGYVLNAYPRGIGPSVFSQTSTAPQAITFVNPANDYPQRIVYSRNGGILTGTISMLDGTKENTWAYSRCR